MNLPTYSTNLDIMPAGNVLVINVAGLSTDLLKTREDLPVLASMIREGDLRPMTPVFPAVTCATQASMSTGLTPTRHGIVANGFYDRATCETRFWHQSERLIQGDRFWKRWRASRKDLTVALLFWQNSKHSDADIVVTPAPIHPDDGPMILSCYSKPGGLSAELDARFGPFPLHKYWGPMTGFESTAWIAKTAAHSVRTRTPNIALVYLPHLDYSLQREGPGGPSVRNDLRQVDGAIGELRDAARTIDARVLVVSEYAIRPVDRCIDINRELRRRGLIVAREIEGKEYLEIGDCRAFAMVDHQVAHIHAVDDAAKQEVLALLRDLRVEAIHTTEEKRSRGIDHPRTGEIVAVAPPNAWFSYYWWLDEAKAPPFAGTVDIHRKPGYDPLELFANRATRRIETNTALIKGSHGRVDPGEHDLPVLISETPIRDLPPTLPATDLPAVVASLVSARS